MSRVYDNWERLVGAVLKREQLRDLARCPSTTSSDYSYDSGSRRFDNRSGAVGKSNTGGVAGRIAAGAALLFAAPARAFALYRRTKPHVNLLDLPEFHLGHLKRFSLRELQVASDNFSNEIILRRCGFFKVYKGRLADGSLVEVKRLHGYASKEYMVEYMAVQFRTEVQVLSMAMHQNVLPLCGFCITPTELLLVYPYMANGSVASCLRDRSESQPVLDWAIRKRIALGSARGLAYLHHNCDPKIIHSDVKAGNMLLDEDFETVVGDIGFANLMDCKETHVITTEVRGTSGHIAPEYLSTGKVSEKIDVYGYGVMLLELITGQRTSDLARLANDDDVMLHDWVKGVLREKKLEMLVDANLQDNYIDDEMDQLIEVALRCTQISPTERPEMSEVVRVLEGHQRFRQELNYMPRPNNIDWIILSSPDMSPVELSGPR